MNTTCRISSCLSLLLAFGCSQPENDAVTPADTPAITFQAGEKVIGRYSLAQMRELMEAQGIAIYDIFYEKEQSYRAFRLCDLVHLGFGEAATADAADTAAIQFIANDGYKVSVAIDKVCREEAYVTFAMGGDERWEILPKYGVTPAPFYLVWSDPDKTPERGYQWPWQIGTIRLIDLQ